MNNLTTLEPVKKLAAIHLKNEWREIRIEGNDKKALWRHADDTIREWLDICPFGDPIQVLIRLTFKDLDGRTEETPQATHFKQTERELPNLVAREFYTGYAVAAGYVKAASGVSSSQLYTEEQKLYAQRILQTCEIPYYPNKKSITL